MFISHHAWLSVFCLLDFSAGCSHWLLCDLDLGVDILERPVLVVGVSSVAALKSGLKTKG